MFEFMSEWWFLVIVYFVVCVCTLFGLQWLATTAYFRGQNRKPMPDSIQRLLRFIFFCVVFSPAVYLSSLHSPITLAITLCLLSLYLYTYLDLSELRGGRPSTFFKSLFIWRWLSTYLLCELHTEIEEKLTTDGSQSYIFGLHPHAILPLGSVLNVATPVNQFENKVGKIKLRGLAASFCFYIPVYRDIFLSGGICDAARYSANRLLDNGYSIFLVPGGATEALYSFPTEDILYLKKRRGFIKLAIERGSHLVPVFSFNENNQYDQFDTKHPWVVWIKTKFQSIFGISLPLLKNIIPRRARITTVVGKPIPVEKDASPSEEKITEVLELYCEKMVELYERNSHFNEPKGKKLTII